MTPEPPPIPPSLGHPAGVQVSAGVDHEEIRLDRQRDPTPLVIGVSILLAVALIVLYPASEAVRDAFSFVLVGAIVGVVALYTTYSKRLSKAKPEIVRISGSWLETDGKRMLWADIASIDRTAGRNGGGLLIRDGDGHAMGIGGHLRPSVVDWLEHRIEAFWEREREHGERDDEARAALEALREREGR